MRVAVAGTFGPLHDGHRALLEEALEHGDEGVTVALTTDEFASRSRSRSVPPYAERKRAVENTLDVLDKWGRDVEIRPLASEHGIATEDPELDGLVVSPETEEEVAEINQIREERGMDPLEGIIAPYVLAADGERISSTRIANGEIDEHGNLLE